MKDTFVFVYLIYSGCSTVVLTTTLPALSAQFEALKPRFQQIDRLEGLVHRGGQDMDVMGE